MKRNIGKKIKDTDGITLVVLVVTIIVLLILAGVTLSSVFSQDGIFHRAEQSNDKYGQAKAQETLTLTLGEAQMQKYEEGITDEQLDNKIGAIQGELLPKEKPEYPNLQNVIVDGYIFEIDRSVPKIVDYIGPADGVIITASVTGNEGWLKQGEVANIRVTGKIKTYSGGTIVTTTVTRDGTTTNLTLSENGTYSIDNITTSTTLTIYAKDSKEKENSKTVPITIRVDNMPPVVDRIEDKTEGMKISFSAVGSDNESGIKHFSYTISPTDGIQTDKVTGTFLQGQNIEITSTEEKIYTITVIAIDNCDNESTESKIDVETIEGITLAEAKRVVNKTNLKEYIGTKITDYKPETGGNWRIYYYDDEGYFGEGKGTLYIRTDKGISANGVLPDVQTEYLSSDNKQAMLKLNPLWSNINPTGELYTEAERATAWLCDPGNWQSYKTEQSAYVVAGPSLEMMDRALKVFTDGKIGISFEQDSEGRYKGGMTGFAPSEYEKYSFVAGPDHTTLVSPANGYVLMPGFYNNNNDYDIVGDPLWRHQISGSSILPMAVIK